MKLETNENIGKYLSELISKNYPSTRKFCIDYIKTKGETPDETSIRNMSNRISQITKGKKSVQIYDLPIFTQLLDVTCEEILSAGTNFVVDSERMNNYKFAFTKDADIWEKYINDESKMILNTDEYRNTVIDYALKYKNYDLLKYLMDKEYIWFISDDNNDYNTTFKAGTSIEQRTIYDTDILNIKLAEEDNLRRQMISLAIEHKDFDMLNSLRAREIPPLYNIRILLYNTSDISLDNYYDYDMIKHIANSDKQILDYFSEEFELKNHTQSNIYTCKFIFPYINDLIKLLIKYNHSYSEILLLRCLEYNTKTYENLKKNILNSYNFLQNFYKSVFYDNSNELIKCTLKNHFSFFDNGNFIQFNNPERKKKGYLTNIISIEKIITNDTKLNHLITELNNIYNNIINIIDIEIN